MKEESLNELKELWVVSFSYTQRQPHVDQLEEHLKNNRKALRSGRELSYFPIVFVENRDIAYKICQDVIKELAKTKWAHKSHLEPIAHVINKLDIFGKKKPKNPIYTP